jgi:hypothetical protein
MKKLLLMCALAGCASLAPKKNSEGLSDQVREYNEGVRWERYAVAAVHVPPRERARFVDDWDTRSTDLKISDFEVVEIARKGPAGARVHVKLSWYKNSEGTLHETHAMQVWERHGDDWLIVDESRLRGPEMPGLPEPLMKD